MKYFLPLLTALFAFGCSANDGIEEAEATALPEQTHGEAAPGSHPRPDRNQPVVAMLEGNVQVIEITAGGKGFSPAAIRLQAGIPARLVFTRTTDASCLEHVSVPDFGIRKEPLPMHEEVAIEFVPDDAGEYTFVCGMGMQQGSLLVSG